MKSRWKLLWLAVLSAPALLSAGCSGINTTQSVSPATFFLPGLLKTDPPKPAAEPAVPTVAESAPMTQVALAR